MKGTSGESSLNLKLTVWQKSIFFEISGRIKLLFQVFIHRRDPSYRLKLCFTDPFNKTIDHLGSFTVLSFCNFTWSPRERKSYFTDVCECDFCPVEWTLGRSNLPLKFFKDFYVKKQYSLAVRRTENEEHSLDPQNWTAKTKLRELFGNKDTLPFRKKKRWLRGQNQ